VPEDPATGSAAAALAAWLAHLARDGTVRATIRQGLEMGRPSELEAEATAEAGRVRSTTVAGEVVTLGEGRLRLG
jgi:trans-2,3-dihydro-3-hydroxyanthranilate isomerase